MRRLWREKELLVDGCLSGNMAASRRASSTKMLSLLMCAARSQQFATMYLHDHLLFSGLGKQAGVLRLLHGSRAMPAYPNLFMSEQVVLHGLHNSLSFCL